MVCAIVCMHACDYQVYMPVHGCRKPEEVSGSLPFWLLAGLIWMSQGLFLSRNRHCSCSGWPASPVPLPSALLSSSCLHSECSPCAGSPGLQCIFHQLHRACRRCQFPLLLWFVKQAFVLSLFPMCVVNCSLNYAESWKLEKRKTWSMVSKPLPQRLCFNSTRH